MFTDIFLANISVELAPGTLSNSMINTASTESKAWSLLQLKKTK